MPPPYDSVISVGGQSLVDGIWHIFGPALEGLTNPLPISLPGFSSAAMRITNLVPLVPGQPPTGGGLQVIMAVELNGEALLSINMSPNPLPAIVPVAVDLTASRPISAYALLTLDVVLGGPRFGLWCYVKNVTVPNVILDPALATTLPGILDAAVARVLSQLGIPTGPGGVPQPQISPSVVPDLLAVLPTVVGSALKEALSRLVGETGRLTYPQRGTGASCDVNALPTLADAELTLALDNTYLLNLGFARPNSADIAGLAGGSLGEMDTTLRVGNTYLLELLCCLVQRLPGFTLPVPPVRATKDINGNPGVCCNFTDATVGFGPIALGGALSICINGSSGKAKTVSLMGSFAEGTPLAEIFVDFSIPVAFDVDDAAALTNLRVLSTAGVNARVNVRHELLVGLILLSIGTLSPAVGAVAVSLLIVACEVGRILLANAVRTVLREASPVSSPVAIPPAVFEAFGNLVPVSVHIDDLTAYSVLQTPTAPWGLLPRLGLAPAEQIIP